MNEMDGMSRGRVGYRSEMGMGWRRDGLEEGQVVSIKRCFHYILCNRTDIHGAVESEDVRYVI